MSGTRASPDVASPAGTAPAAPSGISPGVSPVSSERVPSGAASGVPRSFWLLNGALSITALAILGWLLVLRTPSAELGLDLRMMPTVNAALNTLSTAFLVAGYVAIRRRQVTLHRALMMSAFATSVLFLVGYLAYHYVHGDTRYTGEGAVRVVYLVILASHILLSMTVVPLALTSFYLSLSGRLALHRRVSRVTLPVWLYVSVTGVVVYFMLHVF